MCKFMGSNFSTDALSVMRKLMGSQSMFQDSRLGGCSLIVNSTCFAEGDSNIMELKVVQDMFRGRTNIFLPFKSIMRFLSMRVGRKLLFTFAVKMAKCFLLGKSAVEEGQLLRDIAWCRGHLLVLDEALDSNYDNHWIESYERILVKYPVPMQY